MAVASASDSTTLDWLLDERFPAARRLTLVAVRDRPRDAPDVRALDAEVATDPWVRRLLHPPRPASSDADVHPYQKWTGAHWRMVALAELAVDVRVPGAAEPIEDAFEATLGWLLSPSRRRRKRLIAGRHRACASQEGAALWAAHRVGLGDDRRLDELVERLVTWQWPDGGWNCDVRPEASHSSFNESWMPLRGLAVAGQRDAAGRAAAFLLQHRVIESHRTGAVAHPALEWLRWPAYWHYGLV